MTTTPATFGLVLDCADPDRLAEFWAGALDYVNVGAAGVYVFDEPLLSEMQTTLEENDFRVAALVESIVRSRQFREIRGSQFVEEE